jgi:hypothetical protein
VFFSNFAGRFKIFFVSVVVVLCQRKCAEVEEKESFCPFQPVFDLSILLLYK